MPLWTIAAAANTVILVAYLYISVTITKGLLRSRQTPRDNPLGWATAAIFFTCAFHHGAHPAYMLMPFVGGEQHMADMVRMMYQNWPLTVWDVLTAAAGVWYMSLRTRFPALVRGAAIFEDVRERQRQALDIHDNVVQGLAVAKLQFELDENEEGLATVEQTLAASRKIITDLLGEEGSEVALDPGDFRRTQPADRARKPRHP